MRHVSPTLMKSTSRKSSNSMARSEKATQTRELTWKVLARFSTWSASSLTQSKSKNSKRCLKRRNIWTSDNSSTFSRSAPTPSLTRLMWRMRSVYFPRSTCAKEWSSLTVSRRSWLRLEFQTLRSCSWQLSCNPSSKKTVTSTSKNSLILLSE